jgi:Fe-S-cluster containining protein
VYDAVERRSGQTVAANPWWPCRRGCDACCRTLAAIPRIGRAEWELLREGLDALAPDVRAEVDARIAELAAAERAGAAPRHVVCPLLDREAGACLVYRQRPAACRTYGFYVERDLGLHCGQITEAVAARPPDEDPVLWGNAASVDAALAALAPEAEQVPRPLTAWVAAST